MELYINIYNFIYYLFIQYTIYTIIYFNLSDFLKILCYKYLNYKYITNIQYIISMVHYLWYANYDIIIKKEYIK